MRVAQFFCLAGLLLLAGCGKFFPKPAPGPPTPPPGSSGDYLYVADGSLSLNTIAGFSLGNSTLGTAPNSPYSVGLTPGVLAITPDNKFIYVGSVLGGIYLYAINSNGSLTIQNGGGPVATGVSPATMKIDQSGNWLMAATYSQTGVTGSAPIAFVFQIDRSTGGLTTQNTQVPLDPGSANSIAITPTNQLVYVSLQTGGIDVLAFNANTGTLTKLNYIRRPLQQYGADYGLAIDPAGSYLFVGETGINAVRVFTINANGSLTELATSPVKTGLGPTAVLIDATGAFVYVANRTDNTISAFTLSAAGALTPVSGSPFPTGSTPIALAEDNTKAYIAVACQGGNPDLQVFALDTTVPGKLDAFKTATTGTAPANAATVVATN